MLFCRYSNLTVHNYFRRKERNANFKVKLHPWWTNKSKQSPLTNTLHLSLRLVPFDVILTPTFYTVRFQNKRCPSYLSEKKKQSNRRWKMAADRVVVLALSRPTLTMKNSVEKEEYCLPQRWRLSNRVTFQARPHRSPIYFESTRFEIENLGARWRPL